MDTRRIRKARKAYKCTEKSWHDIQPGDLYLHEVCPPWHEMARGKKFETIRACLRCAEEFGMLCSETRRQLAARLLALSKDVLQSP